MKICISTRTRSNLILTLIDRNRQYPFVHVEMWEIKDEKTSKGAGGM